MVCVILRAITVICNVGGGNLLQRLTTRYEEIRDKAVAHIIGLVHPIVGLASTWLGDHPYLQIAYMNNILRVIKS